MLHGVIIICFVLPILFEQMFEKLGVLFEPHCIISHYAQDHELKINTQIRFDALVSNMTIYF